jgi:hypothetical protein
MWPTRITHGISDVRRVAAHAMHASIADAVRRDPKNQRRTTPEAWRKVGARWLSTRGQHGVHAESGMCVVVQPSCHLGLTVHVHDLVPTRTSSGAALPMRLWSDTPFGGQPNGAAKAVISSESGLARCDHRAASRGATLGTMGSRMGDAAARGLWTMRARTCCKDGITSFFEPRVCSMSRSMFGVIATLAAQQDACIACADREVQNRTTDALGQSQPMCVSCVKITSAAAPHATTKQPGLLLPGVPTLHGCAVPMRWLSTPTEARGRRGPMCTGLLRKRAKARGSRRLEEESSWRVSRPV